jgi:hypothetical protein
VQHVPALFPFYMDLPGPVRVLRDAGELREFVRQGPGLVVASGRALERLPGELPTSLTRPPDRVEVEQPWDRNGRRRFRAWRTDGAEP